MGRKAQNIRELLGAARILWSSAQEASLPDHAENLLRAAEELEDRARLLAHARPGEILSARQEEGLHAHVDLRV